MLYLCLFEHFFRACKGLFGDHGTADDAGNLPLASLPIQRRYLGIGAALTFGFCDEKMLVGHRRDLWQMGDAQYLSAV